MSIRQKLFLAFFILIGIFLLNFFINQKLSSEVVTNTTYLSRSEEVIRNSNLLHKNMIDMQSGFRGYLLTGQEVFLEPYNEGLQTVPSLFNEQISLVSSSRQKRLLDSIRLLHDRWMEYALALIVTKNDTLPEANAKYQELFDKKLKMEEGKKINDLIRMKFIDFDKYEYNLRQKRRIILRESIERTRDISIALTLFSIIVALISCFYIIYIILKRINRMVTLASGIAEGNFSPIRDKRKDEFQKLSESLDQMSGILDRNLKELTSKNKELDQFAYIVSHDLKAPLRGIDNITNWIVEDHASELSHEANKKISLIKGRISRLENMINGLLEYARIGRSKKDILLVDLNVLLADLIEMLVPDSFVVTLDSNMPVFVTEKLRLEQVFSNLISNAVRYNNKSNGMIRISSRTNISNYEFTVSDNGPGIPKEYHDKIFMIFQTLKERDAFESTGIGLAIVKKIIEDQKSWIKIESDSNGTAFTFSWPKLVTNL